MTSRSVVVNLFDQGRWRFTVSVGASFIGKESSLIISTTYIVNVSI